MQGQSAFDGIDLPPFLAIRRNPYRSENFAGSNFTRLVNHDAYSIESAEVAMSDFGAIDAEEGPFLSFLGKGKTSQSPSANLDQAPKHDRQTTRRTPRSTCVSGSQFDAIMAAAKHSRIIGRELNALISLNLPHIRNADPIDRAKLQKVERHHLIQFFADHDVPLTYAWAREAMDSDGTGEHMHVAAHIPSNLRDRLLDIFDKRHGGFPAVDWRDGDTRWRPTPSGRRRSIQGYLVKQCEFMKAKGNGIRWERPGVILGKRIGWSNDLSPNAIKHFRTVNSMSLDLR